MRNLTRNLIPVLAISAVLLLTSCSAEVQNSSQESRVSEPSEVSDIDNQTEDNSEPSTIIPENNDEQKNTKLPSNYCEFKAADIPNIPQEQRGIEARGTENVLFDTKQADDFSVLLVGNYVSTDTENYPEMVNCFDMGIALLEGETVGKTYKAPSEFNGAGQGGYWLYTDRLSDYLSLYRFGENYIVLLRYYDSKDNSYAAFFAVKDNTVYPCLMGDYSAIGGEQMAIVTELSENLAVNEECYTITDKDKNVVFSFDFDAIGDTFTGAHYFVNPNETASEFPETTDKEISINTENYNIKLCYGVYSDGKITHEIMLKVTDSDNNEYEIQVASPALGIGPYNEIPEGCEFKLIAGETNEFPVFAVMMVPITVRGDVLYYATLYRFDGENLDLFFPEGQYGEFFPLISDIESVVIGSNSLSYCDENSNDITIKLSESTPDESLSTNTETSLIKSQETTFEEFVSDAEVTEVSIEEAIAQSNCVVRAKCLSYKDFDEYTDYCFSLVDTYKGKVDDTFYVRWSTYDSTQDTIPFSVKEEYIMPLTYVNSVYFDYPVYNVYAHMTMLCNNDNIASVSVGDNVIKPDKSEVKIDSFASYVASIPDTSATMFEDYITSTALNDVISQSDYIVKAKITGEPNKTGSDRGIYPCEITQRFKGDISDSFEAVFMYDSVEVGNEYYFFLTKPDETSRFYIISSKNSIYDANNDAVLKALENSGII